MDALKIIKSPTAPAAGFYPESEAFGEPLMGDIESSDSFSILLEKVTEFISVRLYLSEDRLKLYLDCERAAPEFKIEDPESSDPEPAAENSNEPKLSQEIQALNHKVTAEEIVEVVRAKVDQSLVDMGMISRVADEVNKGHSVTKRRIAKGTAPEEGEDGRLQLLVKQFEEERQ
jgi:hypothetical protein